jgi:methyl-accepting chemotaxis protein
MQMTEFRLRPESNYLHTADWKELFVLTEHWRSDMNFFRDELRFLNNVSQKYFIKMINKKSLVKLENLFIAVNKLSKERKAISFRIKNHLIRLGLLMENAFSRNEQQFRDEHAKLEEDIAAFAKNYRKVKRAVFSISEQVLKSDKQQKLLVA